LALLKPFSAGLSIDTEANFSAHSALARDGGLMIAGPAIQTHHPAPEPANAYVIPLS
jgi:hypothetical protein